MADENKVVNTNNEVNANNEKKDIKDKPFEQKRGNQFNKGKFNRPNRGGRGFNQDAVKIYEERVVDINRICKTVQGGRHMRFSAIVVVGDKKGKYGFALEKSGEVPDAMKKATEAAKRNINTISIVGKARTIPHEVIGEFGATKVYLKPAPEGTGIIAGGPVRAILELSGLKNVVSKVYGARASINVIRATDDGIRKLKNYHKIRELRGLEEKKND